MPVKKLQEFLDNHQIKYTTLAHPPAFTAQEVAANAHISGKQLVKTVIIKVDEHLAMMVLPAKDKVAFEALQKAIGGKVTLAEESDFKEKFHGCELGAIPPFGNLYDMPVFISSHLHHQDHILFSAGSHAELIEMGFHDFERLVKPKMLHC